MEDLCHNLKSNILVFVDRELGKWEYPQVCEATDSMFGDTAFVIGGELNKYLEIVLNTFQQTCQSKLNKSEHDMVDYLNELREDHLETYSVTIKDQKNKD